jgi:predicted transcriptional regulator
MNNREIAAQLGLSEHTIKNYIFHIFNKLGISSRVELVLYAVGQRLSSKLRAGYLKKGDLQESNQPRQEDLTPQEELTPLKDVSQSQ